MTNDEVIHAGIAITSNLEPLVFNGEPGPLADQVAVLFGEFDPPFVLEMFDRLLGEWGERLTGDVDFDADALRRDVVLRLLDPALTAKGAR